jgi:hypothetical protein
MSGDIDMCRTGHQAIPLRKKQEILGSIGAVGGPRSWKVGALFIDILGELESETCAPLREISTEWGIVKVIPPELLIVERVLTSVYPAAYEPDRKCALMLLGSALSGTFPVDWAEIERLARTPEYDVYEELTAMKKEAVEQQGDIRYDITWTTLGEYLGYLERRGVSPNVALILAPSPLGT